MVDLKNDVNFSFVVKTGIALTVLTLLILAGMWLLFGKMQAREARQDSAPSPVASRQGQPPPGPILQVAEQADMKKMREREDAILNTYGWTDKRAGIARIPVSEAMKLMLEKQKTHRSGK